MSKLKTACLWLVIPFSLSAAGFDTDKILAGIEDRYNHIQTLQVDFVQTYKFRGPTRIPEKGTLYLHKPGRMRWQYSSPEGKLFISDGKLLLRLQPGRQDRQKNQNEGRRRSAWPAGVPAGETQFPRGLWHVRGQARRRRRRDHGVPEIRPGCVCGSVIRGRAWTSSSRNSQ